MLTRPEVSGGQPGIPDRAAIPGKLPPAAREPESAPPAGPIGRDGPTSTAEARHLAAPDRPLPATMIATDIPERLAENRSRS